MPRPELLWNVAKAYRKQYEIDRAVQHLWRARVLYRNYAQLVTSARERGEAREEEAAVAAELRRLEQAAAGGTGPEAERGGSTTAPRALPGDRSVAELQIKSRDALEHMARPLHRRWWLWTAVGGAVAVGLGVGLGVGLTRGTETQALPASASFP